MVDPVTFGLATLLYGGFEGLRRYIKREREKAFEAGRKMALPAPAPAILLSSGLEKQVDTDGSVIGIVPPGAVVTQIRLRPGLPARTGGGQ